jgi:hypothetical protein
LQPLLVKLPQLEITPAELQAIYQAIAERRLDIKDQIWQLELTVPAGATIYAKIDVPKDIVFLELGYEFEPDALDVLTFTHYHDGRLLMQGIKVSDSVLSFRYTRPEICAYYYEVILTNLDTADHYIKTIGLYKAIPRELARRMGIA